MLLLGSEGVHREKEKGSTKSVVATGKQDPKRKLGLSIVDGTKIKDTSVISRCKIVNGITASWLGTRMLNEF